MEGGWEEREDLGVVFGKERGRGEGWPGRMGVRRGSGGGSGERGGRGARDER